jgi:hypothetical protein
MITTKPPLLDLSGDPEEMGYQHGESLREVIQELAYERLDIIVDTNPGIHRGDIKEIAEKVLTMTRDSLPSIYIESLATARAANLDHWLLLVGGGFSDIHDLASKAMGNKSMMSECTLWPAVGPGGTVRIAGTWDSHATAQKALVVVRRRLSNGLYTLALSTAGWPMQQGVTSSGLAFAIANLVATTLSSGTSYICALPEIVRANTVQEAAVHAETIPLCSARYFSFADANGGFVALESDGCTWWKSNVKSPHTNHFIFDRALAVEGRPNIAVSSANRCRAAITFMDGVVRSIEELFHALAFNDGTDSSIARLGTGRDDRTCAAFVLEPSVQRMHFTFGPPTQDGRNRIFSYGAVPD